MILYILHQFCAQVTPYPCWDHSSRTSERKLMNQNVQIVVEVLPEGKDGFSKYTLASMQDLKTLKCNNPNSKVRYADITPHVKQNCDAQSNIQGHHR